MPNDQDFINKLQKKIKKMNPNSADFKASIKAFMEYVKNDTSQHQKNLLGNILSGQQTQMQNVTLGFGPADYLGSTQLGPCTAVMIQAALGQGAESGSLNANRTSKTNQKYEEVQEKVLEVINEQNFNPSPFNNTPYK